MVFNLANENKSISFLKILIFILLLLPLAYIIVNIASQN